MHTIRTIVATLAVALLWAGTAGALSAEWKCRKAKNYALGGYALCRHKAEKKRILTGDAVKYAEAIAKCESKLATKLTKADEKAAAAGTSCWSSAAADAHAKAVTDAYSDAAVSALGNGVLIVADECPASQPCRADLATCQSSAPHLPSASGQSANYGAHSDGNLRAGVMLSFTDNADGTITDNNTKLMWEKKGGTGPNAWYLRYDWRANISGNMDGTMVTDFLAMLNDTAGGGVNCFAGHCDWRIPNVKELLTIIDYGKLVPYTNIVAPPAAPPAFHNEAACAEGCSDVTLPECTCTARGPYWSSTTNVDNPALSAWVVDSGIGLTVWDNKQSDLYVRAVRGGL